MEPVIRPLALLRLGTILPDTAPPDAAKAACIWLNEMACGQMAIALEMLPAPSIDPAERLALASIPEAARAVIARRAPTDARPLVVIGPPSVRPHCWQTRAGRRYALVPANASIALIAHELGHLLFGWPDLRLPPGSGAICLMAPLAGEQPARPCAPMRVAAGWETAAPLVAGLAPRDLPEGRSYRWADLLVERQGDMLAGFRQNGQMITLAFTYPVVDAAGCTLAVASRGAGAHGGGAH